MFPTKKQTRSGYFNRNIDSVIVWRTVYGNFLNVGTTVIRFAMALMLSVCVILLVKVQVESLQKSSAENNEQKQSVAELNFQINRLQQQNTELEHRNTSTLRDKQGLDDKIGLLEREKERLARRIKRLEVAEQERHGLETKVEKMLAVERDNRRLELKVKIVSLCCLSCSYMSTSSPLFFST